MRDELLKENRLLALRLSKLYSGQHGMIKGLLQLFNHYFFLKEINEHELADIMMKIIVIKIKDINILKKIGDELNQNIIFYDYPFNNFKTLIEENRRRKNKCKKIILDSIVQEMLIKKEGKNLSKLKNSEKINSLIEEIILDTNGNIEKLKEYKSADFDIKIIKNRKN